MQVTTPVQEKESDWLNYLIIFGGITIGIFLVGVVVMRMGLLNGLLHRGEAVAIPTRTLTFTAENMRFGQDVLRVEAGQPVRLELENKDMYVHSFDIDALDWHVEMPANETVLAEFTAVPPGTYTIYCAIAGHHQAGMVATLIVE